MTKDVFKFSGRPEFRNPALIVGWGEDAGKLSPKVINYLNSRLRSKSFCEIEPGCFFSLDGVAIGFGASVSNINSIAIGSGADAQGLGVVIGTGSTITAGNNVVVGNSGRISLMKLFGKLLLLEIFWSNTFLKLVSPGVAFFLGQ